MTNLNLTSPQRRTILKSAAIGSAVIASSLPSLSFAKSLTSPAVKKAKALPAIGMLSIKQNQTQAAKTIVLKNNTGDVVRLHSIKPEDFAKPQGSLKVEVRFPKEQTVLKPNEELVINLKATTANAGMNTHGGAISNVVNARLHFDSDNTAFTGVIPVTVIDAMPV